MLWQDMINVIIETVCVMGTCQFGFEGFLHPSSAPAIVPIDLQQGLPKARLGIVNSVLYAQVLHIARSKLQGERIEEFQAVAGVGGHGSATDDDGKIIDRSKLKFELGKNIM